MISTLFFFRLLLFVWSEAPFVRDFLKKNEKKHAGSNDFTFRYIDDDVFYLDNSKFGRTVVVVIVWLLDLQLPMQSGTSHHWSREFETRSWRDILDTTSCDSVCQLLETDQWFSPGTAVSSTNQIDRHDITEILLKVEFNTINHKPSKVIMLIALSNWPWY